MTLLVAVAAIAEIEPLYTKYETEIEGAGEGVRDKVSLFLRSQKDDLCKWLWPRSPTAFGRMCAEAKAPKPEFAAPPAPEIRPPTVIASREDVPPADYDSPVPAAAELEAPKITPIRVKVGSTDDSTVRTMRPGLGRLESFRDCKACPEMVVIPAGAFLMGARGADKAASPEERPIHKVSIAKPFAISQHEITSDQWQACLREQGCSNYWPDVFGDGQHPVVNVSWNDARNYAAWLQYKTGNVYRLPSEAEWEYAARASTKTKYWWGDKIGLQYANYNEGSKQSERPVAERTGHTQPVPTHAPNFWGLFNVHGNVAEWVQDCWHKNYITAPADSRPWHFDANGNCARRVVKGGSWLHRPEQLRSSARQLANIDQRNGFTGIRLVRELNFASGK